MAKCKSTNPELREDLSAHTLVKVQKGQLTQYTPKVLHAGIITHTCTLEEHPTEILCMCECRYTWVRNYK